MSFLTPEELAKKEAKRDARRKRKANAKLQKARELTNKLKKEQDKLLVSLTYDWLKTFDVFKNNQPLAIGIHLQIKPPPPITQSYVSRAVAIHVWTTPYLQAMTNPKAMRVNLDGSTFGEVGDGAADESARRLAAASSSDLGAA